MKLSQILEARYAFPKYVQWVVDTLEKGGGEKSLEGIPKDDTKIVVDQITKQFGKPHYLEFAGEEERNYYLWQNHAGGPVSYDIAFWPDWGELLVHRIRGVPQHRFLEARYSGSHPIVDWAINQTEYERKTIPGDQVKQIIADLSSRLGQPEYGESPDGTRSWYWVEHTDERSGEVLDAILVRDFGEGQAHLIVNR